MNIFSIIIVKLLFQGCCQFTLTLEVFLLNKLASFL